jgi:methyl-accepting chemotaxis protein
MSATQQVNGSISEIQSAVSQNASERAHVKQAMDRTVEFAEEVNAILQDIVASVSQSSDMATGIATATEEQSAAAEQITSNVEVVDRISAETAEAMLESSNVLGRLTQLASNLDATIKSLAS